MANFMGPMAPPQAAPSQPPQLDIRTNPGQRAQFKSFMQGMQVPPTTAPVAPMLPAPTPMDDIDIFAPAPMADGGVVGGLQNLGQMSDQMVDALNTVVYGGSQGGGMPSSGGIGGPMSSGGGFGGGQMPAPLPPITTLPPGATPPALLPPVPPPIGAAPKLPDRLSLNDSALLGMPTPSYMPMDPDGDGMDQQGRPMESQLTDEQRAQAEQDQQERLKNLRSRFSEGGVFGSGSMGSPLSRLGMMGGLGSIFGYEDGGPVGMFLGGDPRAYGDERGRQDTSETARERVGGTTNVFEGDSSSREERDETERRVREVVAAAQRAEDKGQFFEDTAVSQSPVNLFPGSSMRGEPVASMGVTDADEVMASALFDDEVNVGEAQRLANQLMNMRAGDFDFGPAIEPIAAPIIDPNADVFAIPVMEQIAEEQRARRSVEASDVGGPIGSDNVIFSGVEDTSVEGPLAEAGSSVDRLMVTPITNLRGGGQRTAGEDLTMRSESGIAKKLPQNVIENINKGRPAVIDARSGQITGYVGEGLFGIGNAYTGRPGYDPFGPNATFDPARNAYIVQPDIMSNVGAPASDDRVLSPTILPPATDPADTTPPPLMITPPTTGLPPSGPSPTEVLVPSTRTNVPITAPSLLPTQGVAPTFLPQSFLDLLANFNRPAPVAMQDGGAVLDKAADDFLEALKVA